MVNLKIKSKKEFVDLLFFIPFLFGVLCIIIGIIGLLILGFGLIFPTFENSDSFIYVGRDMTEFGFGGGILILVLSSLIYGIKALITEEFLIKNHQ